MKVYDNTNSKGQRTVVFYHDGKGNMVDEKEATHFTMYEYDASGMIIQHTIGTIDKERA